MASIANQDRLRPVISANNQIMLNVFWHSDRPASDRTEYGPVPDEAHAADRAGQKVFLFRCGFKTIALFG
jgi:hypothetical protein